MVHLLAPRIIEWYCPSCGATDQTKADPGGRPQSHGHTCPRLRFLSVPMVPKGTRARIEVREPEDYVGSEHVQTDQNGRPLMSLVTERSDGSNDVVVYAPLATGGVR
jgi:hypothetical protein